MATFSRVGLGGWRVGDDATDQSRVGLGGWYYVQGAGGGAPADITDITASLLTSTSGRLTVTSGAGSGTTLYIVIGPSSGWSDPSAAQIAAGQLAGGGAATWDDSAAWTGAGQYLDASGLTAGTAYRAAAVVYDDVLLDYSGVVVSAEFTTSAGAYTGDAAESATAADVAAASLVMAAAAPESAPASDAQSSALVAGAATSETAVATDAPQSTQAHAAALAETATATDATTGEVAGNNDRAASETATATDTQQAAQIHVAALAEQITVTDAATGSASMAASVAESAAATDTAAIEGGFSVSVVESVTVGDTTTATLICGGQVVESISPADAPASVAQMLALLTEQAVAVDSPDGYPQGSQFGDIAESAAAADAVAGVIAGAAVIFTRAPRSPHTAGVLLPAADAGAIRPRNNPGSGR